MPRRNIKEVLERYTDQLMAVRGVVGVAEGKSMGRPCIKVLVVDRKSKFLKEIPGTLDGYRVRVEESGEFRALGI